MLNTYKHIVLWRGFIADAEDVELNCCAVLCCWFVLMKAVIAA